MSDLSFQQRNFINEYFVDFNGTRAAERAGYKGDDNTLAVTASRLLKRPKIKAAIEKRILEMEKSQDPKIRKAAKLIAETRRVRRKRKACYVYFIREQFGLTKVGSTASLNSRMGQIKTACPYEIELVALISHEDAPSIEKEIHKDYSHKRHRGEWFNLSHSDIDSILKVYGGEWSN